MITKIQSFTDVITNSSSTVFVMDQSSAEYYNNLETDGCVGINKIDVNWLRNHPWEVEMVCKFLKVDPSVVTTTYDDYGYGEHWKTPEEEVWLDFLEQHKEEINEVFKDLYWVDIEDHFENAYEVTENALDDAKWHDYRH